MSKKGDAASSKKPTILGSVNARSPKYRRKPGVVRLKHHHAKPYRKRHVGILALLVAVAIALLATAVQFSAQIKTNTKNAQQLVSELISIASTQKQTVQSAYGFSVQYNPNQYYATALDSSTNNVYIGDELSTARNYQTIRISGSRQVANAIQSALTILYLPGNGVQSLAQVEANNIANDNNTQSTLVKLSSAETAIDGVTFLKTQWRRDYKATILPDQVSPLITTYSGIVNGQPLFITVKHGTSTDSSGYDEIIKTMKFTKQTIVLAPTVPEEQPRSGTDKSIIDTLLLSNIATAAAATPPSTEYISALYSPAVVRIYNVYCQDVYVAGKLFYKNSCGGTVGSGFFVSSDGYIATNGHVVSASPKEFAIQNALLDFVNNGQDAKINMLATLAKVDEADFVGLKKQEQIIATLVDKLYALPDSTFTATNAVNNLLVTLGEIQPDVTELQALTQQRKEYPDQTSIKRATIVGIDYRAVDGVNGYRASDVALIKISGNNYPLTKLGSISDVSQGSVLNILGFPGRASNNGLVDNDESRVTLTTGRVAALKNVDGSAKKLLETDTIIGHGNSGGPALSDRGVVVGIATYTADGSGTGDGTYNYVRDIADLKELAASNSVAFIAKSTTQDQWQQGIDEFYKAHYTKAIALFDAVRTAYPAHPSAATLIETAKYKIASGEEVSELPVMQVLIGSLALVIVGAIVTIIVIVRHNKKHKIYVQHVTSGLLVPIRRGSPPVYVNKTLAKRGIGGDEESQDVPADDEMKPDTGSKKEPNP